MAHTHIHFVPSERLESRSASTTVPSSTNVLDCVQVVPVVGMRAIYTAWKISYTDPSTTNSSRSSKRKIGHHNHPPTDAPSTALDARSRCCKRLVDANLKPMSCTTIVWR